MMTSSFSSSPSDDFPWIRNYPAGIAWDMPVPVYPVPQMLDEAVRNFGTRPGFDFLGKKYSWAELGGLADRMAAGLQGMGVGKGVKVGLFLANSPIFLISYYAVLKAGGTVVNYNPLYSVKELKHQIEDSETDIMVTLNLTILCDKMKIILGETRLKKMIVARFTDILPFPKNILFRIAKAKDIAVIGKSDKVVWFHDLISHGGRPQPVDINPHDDIAVLQYTGGTTGTPKGAMLTHANVTANAEQAMVWLGGGTPGGEKMLGVLPFFHVFAMTAVMNMSVRGAFEIIALPRFDLEQTLKLIDKKKPSFFPAVPAIYNAINNYKKIGSYNLKSLRYCISGGAPLPVEVKKEFERLTGCVVVEGYGLTEASPVLCCNPPVGNNKAGSIGMPLPGTIIEIIDPEDRKTIMPRGERGELCATGPQVMKGYYNQPKETANVLIGGRLHTGDIGVIDDDGYVFIVDRLKDMIITNGYKVYPRNVEEIIYLHPAVEECIVAGIPDAARGEVVKAWVKPREGASLTEQELKAFMEEKISRMEMPRSIEIRATPLPKTMIGKLSRKDILAEEAVRKQAS
jgi:long-chain acyl-CoA synthetase